MDRIISFRFIRGVVFLFYSTAVSFLLFFSFFLFFSFPELSHSAVTLKCATVAPGNSDWAVVMKRASEEIQKKTQGAIRVTWYFSGVLGDEPEVAKKLKQGKIDCAGLTGNGISYVIPFMRLLELPFLLRNYEEVAFIKKEVAKFFTKIAADYNIKFISLADLGFIYIFSKIPINKLDDVKGRTVWIWKDDYLAEYIGKVLKTTFNVKLLRLPLADVRNYLSSIEVLYNAPYPLVVLGWDSAVKYYLTPPLNFAFTAVLINQKSFEKVPPQYRDTIEGVLRKYIDIVSEMNMKNNRKILGMLEKKGIKRVKFSQSEIDRAEKLFKQKIWLPLKDKLYPSWLITQVLTKLSEFRARKK